MKKFWLLIAAITALFLGGCSDSGNDIPEENENPQAPELLFTGGDTFTLTDAGQELLIGYTVLHPKPGATVSLSNFPAWVTPLRQDASSVRLRIDANEGAQRRAEFRLEYPGARALTAVIVQAGKGEEPPAVPVLRITQGAVFDLESGEEDRTVSFTVENPVEGGTVTVKSSDKWLHLYEQDETSFSFTVEANEGAARRGTFTLSYPGAQSQTVTVNQAAKGEEPAVKPSFSALSTSGVTAATATLNCRFDYAGTETVAEAGFCYRAGSGAEQSVPTTASTGTKSVTLDDLTASTAYTWYFYAEIGDELYVSPTQSFTTPAATVTPPAPAGDVWRTGWAELPTEDGDNADYYYAHHYCPDFRAGSYQARNYTVCFSAEHHCPVWVAAPRHRCYNGSANRTDAYSQDPQIPSNLQYRSKSTGGGCNKGHMLGSAERTRSTAINKQVFYYTNIAPQYSSGFNTGGGGWNILEDWIDGQVCADTTYLVIGTYFERFTDGYGATASPKRIEFGGRSDVSCPTMFYIAVLRTKRGNTGKSVMECPAGELKCAAFVRAHSNSLKGQEVTRREMMSIADLEKLTGHTFFANVPNAPKSSFTPSDWGL